MGVFSARRAEITEHVVETFLRLPYSSIVYKRLIHRLLKLLSLYLLRSP